MPATSKKTSAPKKKVVKKVTKSAPAKATPTETPPTPTVVETTETPQEVVANYAEEFTHLTTSSEPLWEL